MITREQIENLGFVYKQTLLNNNKDFVNDKIGIIVSLSLDGKVDVIYGNHKNWGNIDSIGEMIKIIDDIRHQQ